MTPVWPAQNRRVFETQNWGYGASVERRSADALEYQVQSVQAQLVKPPISAEQLAIRVRELGQQITADYTGRDLIVVPVLQGAMLFFSDLVREINLDLRFDVVRVRSYRSGTSPDGAPELLIPPSEEWRGKPVLFVESIVDTGVTLRLLRRLAEEKRTESARVCALLDKPSRRTVEAAPDYCGFTVPDLFVVGYGLDLGGRHRNHPDIRCVTES